MCFSRQSAPTSLRSSRIAAHFAPDLIRSSKTVLATDGEITRNARLPPTFSISSGNFSIDANPKTIRSTHGLLEQNLSLPSAISKFLRVSGVNIMLNIAKYRAVSQ
jgi:hypothetical protein